MIIIEYGNEQLFLVSKPINILIIIFESVYVFNLTLELIFIIKFDNNH